MTARTGRRRMRWLAGVLGIAPLLLAPSALYAIFPPVIQDPGSTVVVPVVVPTVKPIVVPAGDPDPTPVVTHRTPEPASIVTGLMGLALGVCFLRRKRLAHV